MCQGRCQVDNINDYSDIIGVIKQYKKKEGALIQVLHLAQQMNGHLPLDLQREIADVMDISISKVSSVVSFYSYFATVPRGKHTIRVCMGTACYVGGGKKIINHIENQIGCAIGETSEDGKFSFEIARCIGACGLAPAIMIDDVVYKQVRANKIDSILSKY